MERGGVLFLDLSTQIGWVYGTLAHVERGPEWGVWLLPRVSLGQRLKGFCHELACAIERLEPAMIGIEAPLAAQKQSNADTATLLICLAGVAEMVAAEWSVDFKRRSVNTIRAQVCGRCQRTEQETDDRIDIKEAIIRPWIEARGWDITDHNARDAAIGWSFEMGIKSAKPERRGALL